jgi:hypothetical protein
METYRLKGDFDRHERLQAQSLAELKAELQTMDRDGARGTRERMAVMELLLSQLRACVQEKPRP